MTDDRPCRHEFVPLLNAISGLTNIERCRNCDARRFRPSTVAESAEDDE